MISGVKVRNCCLCIISLIKRSHLSGNININSWTLAGSDTQQLPCDWWTFIRMVNVCWQQREPYHKSAMTVLLVFCLESFTGYWEIKGIISYFHRIHFFVKFNEYLRTEGTELYHDSNETQITSDILPCLLVLRKSLLAMRTLHSFQWSSASSPV